MNEPSTEHIAFEVETERILQLLSREIYDSPLALLRENVQNAYDAILMRATSDGMHLSDGLINVQVTPGCVTIADNGIGMDDDVLRSHFWKAGSSGKKSELAARSGVIGTFGIGAMANFGVATRLKVETRSIHSDTTLISEADRATLSIAADCITLSRTASPREPGTCVTAYIEPAYPLDENAATRYLAPFVQFLPVRVLVNDSLISQASYESNLANQMSGYSQLGAHPTSHGVWSVELRVHANAAGNVIVQVSNLSLDGTPVAGDMFLVQNGGPLMGYRNYFGLAPVPVSGHFQFGGIANLSMLSPTAGREALSRESIALVSQLIVAVEHATATMIANTDTADRNTAFQNHLLTTNRLDLADRITIRLLPDGTDIPLADVQAATDGKQAYYYHGRDPSILQTYATDQTALLQVSQANPRRKLQLRFLTDRLKVQQVPDAPTLLETYSPSDLSRAEAAFVIRMLSTLSDDYLLPNAVVHFARISHGVNVLTRKEGDELLLFVARDSTIVRPVLECYDHAYEVFGGMVKDFVRNHIYPRISEHVPSSTRQGADALRKALERRRELYRYDESEVGLPDSLLADFLSGATPLAEIITRARQASRSQTQTVRRDQVGRVEQEIPDVIHAAAPSDIDPNYDAAPPILREDFQTRMKVLVSERPHSQLNNFLMLLGLSDRLFRLERDFFLGPHTTKVIWGGHRIVYIFGHASGTLTLYYDIELRESLEEGFAGGTMLPTTTLITENRIFVPVANQLRSAFELHSDTKEFFVRFDSLVG